jgi:hypothetical protein
MVAKGSDAATAGPALATGLTLAVPGLGFTGYYLAGLLDFARLAYILASLVRLVLYLNPTLLLLLGRTHYGKAIGRNQRLGPLYGLRDSAMPMTISPKAMAW